MQAKYLRAKCLKKKKKKGTLIVSISSLLKAGKDRLVLTSMSYL